MLQIIVLFSVISGINSQQIRNIFDISYMCKVQFVLRIRFFCEKSYNWVLALDSAWARTMSCLLLMDIAVPQCDTPQRGIISEKENVNVVSGGGTLATARKNKNKQYQINKQTGKKHCYDVSA